MINLILYIAFDLILFGSYLLPICRVTFYWRDEEKSKIFSPILVIILMIFQRLLGTEFQGFTWDFFRKK
ncbi:hypothetical protein [Streptococcus sobrinus]|uniref:hypothetical protein n=1 Tax=Streptococcus sobrinus TaxID=1310 RepID=UPI000363B700|nr:hypothetical protein [Streptococcus sobrinus]